MKYNKEHLYDEVKKKFGEFGWHADVFRSLIECSDSAYAACKPEIDEVLKMDYNNISVTKCSDIIRRIQQHFRQPQTCSECGSDRISKSSFNNSSYCKNCHTYSHALS